MGEVDDGPRGGGGTGRDDATERKAAAFAINSSSIFRLIGLNREASLKKKFM